MTSVLGYVPRSSPRENRGAFYPRSLAGNCDRYHLVRGLVVVVEIKRPNVSSIEDEADRCGL